MELTKNNHVYIIVTYVVITVNYCKCMLLLYQLKSNKTYLFTRKTSS